VGDKKLRRKGASASTGDYVLGVEERDPTRVVGRRGGAAPEWLALGPSKDAKLDAIKMHASLLADACISRPEHHSMLCTVLMPNRRGACMLVFAAQHGCSAPQPSVACACALAVRCTCTACTTHTCRLCQHQLRKFASQTKTRSRLGKVGE
jgi:hypothetical protein